jgi:hypothetical protein
MIKMRRRGSWAGRTKGELGEEKGGGGCHFLPGNAGYSASAQYHER